MNMWDSKCKYCYRIGDKASLPPVVRKMSDPLAYLSWSSMISPDWLQVTHYLSLQSRCISSYLSRVCLSEGVGWDHHFLPCFRYLLHIHRFVAHVYRLWSTWKMTDQVCLSHLIPTQHALHISLSVQSCAASLVILVSLLMMWYLGCP